MRHFSEFKIEKTTRFAGDKIKVDRVVNTEVVIRDYDYGKSQFYSGECLKMQIEYKGELRVIFCGSKNLYDTLEKIGRENLPFTTTITRTDQKLEFN